MVTEDEHRLGAKDGSLSAYERWFALHAHSNNTWLAWQAAIQWAQSLQGVGGANVQRVNDAGAREIERLRAVLEQYGDHTDRCDKRHESKPCSCGWDALSGDSSAPAPPRLSEAFSLLNAAIYYVPRPRELHAEIVEWLNGASKQEASPDETKVSELHDRLARAYNRLQCADVPRGPWHTEVGDYLLFGDSPEETSKCLDCGVQLVTGARHFSGCKSQSGEPALKARDNSVDPDHNSAGICYHGVSLGMHCADCTPNGKGDES